MPLPIILAGIAIVTAAGGTTMIGLGARKMKKAKEKVKNAQDHHQQAIFMLNRKRDEVQTCAQTYGQRIFWIHETTVRDLVDLIKKLHKKTRIKSFQIPDTVNIEFRSIDQFNMNIVEPAKDFIRMIGAVSAGAAASGSTIGLVGLFGTASTGTAISTLSGAAATNATLAWLGGGAVAAGGGGMAVGSIVLGGITVGTAMLITGFIILGKGEKALTQAQQYESDVNVKIKKLKNTEDFLERVIKRMSELDNLVRKLEKRVRDSMKDVDPNRFDPSSDRDIEKLAVFMQFSKALCEVMRTPVMDINGNISDDSEKVVIKYIKLAGDD